MPTLDRKIYVRRLLRIGASADEGAVVGVVVKGQELAFPVVPVATEKKITAMTKPPSAAGLGTVR